MSDSDPWGYDQPGAGGPLSSGGAGAASGAEETLDSKLDNRFAEFRAVGGVRQQVIDNFVKMIDSDPDAIVKALRQVMHHSGPGPGGE